MIAGCAKFLPVCLAEVPFRDTKVFRRGLPLDNRVVASQKFACNRGSAEGSAELETSTKFNRLHALRPVNERWVGVVVFNTTKSRTSRASTKDLPRQLEYVSKCSYCGGSHRLHTCALFKRVPPPQRSVHVNQQRLCFNCLKAGHNSKRCYSKPFCAVVGCGRKHHTLLHEHFQQVLRSVASPNPTSTPLENQAAETPAEHKAEVKCNGNKSSSLVYFNIVPVRVRCDGRELLVNAFLDQGSSANLCDQRLLEVLNVSSEDVSFGLTTVGCATQQMKG